MKKKSKIYIAGHSGMVGSAIIRKLLKEGYTNLVYKTSSELDLRNQKEVTIFFETELPEYVFLAAAYVGGIHANNTFPADFLYNNIMIEANVIHAAYTYNVTKLLFLGSSCIYPKYVSQPIKENTLLTGTLEPTNEAYAIAKIAGIELCKFYRKQYHCNYISVMPTNLYGIHDNFDLENAHVLPALINKFHEAKINDLPSVTVWGTGNVRREFMHVDDLSDILLYLMLHYSDESHINVGVGTDITIQNLAYMIKNITGYKGKITNDTTMPDGTPRKLLDISLLSSIGYSSPPRSLEEGIQSVYTWYLSQTISSKALHSAKQT